MSENAEQPKNVISPLVEHAEEELKLINMGADTTDEANKLMHDQLIEMVKAFSAQGHSGFSANYAIGILMKLLSFKPLTPLTGKDDEWVDVTEYMDRPLWQNRRCSRVFKEADGSVYDVEGRVFLDAEGTSFTKQPDSRVAVTFPYTPATDFIEVESTNDKQKGADSAK